MEDETIPSSPGLFELLPMLNAGVHEKGKLFDLVHQNVKALRDSKDVFLWIQITLVFPAVLLFLGILYMFLKTFPRMMPFMDTEYVAPLFPETKVALVVFTVLSVVILALFINVVASLNYTVGKIHKGKSFTFFEVVRAMPGLWKGYFVTTLWSFLLKSGAAFVVWMTATLLTMYFSHITITGPVHVVVYLLIYGMFMAFLFVCGLYIPALVAVANGVACFERRFGIETFRKAHTLLEGRWMVAFRLASIESISVAVITIAAYLFTGNISGATIVGLEDIPLLAKLAWGVMLVVFSSLFMELSITFWALFYISCKVYHHESLDPLEAGEYEPIDLGTGEVEFTTKV